MDKHCGGQATVCIVGVENLASIRVSEKNGYREFTRTELKGLPVIQFRRELARPFARGTVLGE